MQIREGEGYEKGMMDSIRIYERALSPFEVAELHQGEELPSLLDGLVGVWVSQSDGAFKQVYSSRPERECLILSAPCDVINDWERDQNWPT